MVLLSSYLYGQTYIFVYHLAIFMILCLVCVGRETFFIFTHYCKCRQFLRVGRPPDAAERPRLAFVEVGVFPFYLSVFWVPTLPTFWVDRDVLLWFVNVAGVAGGERDGYIFDYNRARCFLLKFGAPTDPRQELLESLRNSNSHQTHWTMTNEFITNTSMLLI